jgi:hypothetical protein
MEVRPKRGAEPLGIRRVIIPANDFLTKSVVPLMVEKLIIPVAILLIPFRA